MSLSSRLFGRSCRFAMPRIVLRQNSSFYIRSGPSRILVNKPLFSVCKIYWQTFATNVDESPCWKCGKPGREARFFCKDCNALQKPDKSYNNFHLLGLSETFDIDSSELSKKFRQLQTVLHPDKFSNASDVSCFCCVLFYICIECLKPKLNLSSLGRKGVLS